MCVHYKSTSFSYDANSNLVSYRDPNNVGQDCVFDARNRDVSCTDTQGDTTSRVYDAHSNVVTMTDALAQSTSCVFDARDRKSTCTDRISATTTYVYDVNNNLLNITDAENSVTTYVYDVRNLLETETYPTGDAGTTQKTYTYDAARRLVSRLVNTVEAPLVSETTNYVYDMANRLTTRAYPDETNADDLFTYDAASRLVSAESQRYANTVSRSYDDASRLSSETLNIDGNNYAIAYAYDVADRQTLVTYPNGKQVVRSFTDRNQLQDVSYDGTVLSTSVYDAAMRETNRNFSNGVNTVKTYRNDNLMSDIDVTNGGTNILDLNYTYDANKRKLSETDALRPDASQTFNYDNEDRLTTWGTDSGVTNQTWSLSAVGDWDSTSRVGSNPISETRSHTDVHEVTAINGNALTYDFKGNLATNTQNSQDYIWDAENRMKSIGNSVDADYRYDALGRRVQKSVTESGTTTVTTFVCGGAQVFTEYINGLPGRTYVYHGYVDEPIAIINILGDVAYYHQNHLFSVEVITDNAGALVETYDYDSHGAMTIRDGAGVVLSASSVGNAYGFTGRRLDAESGLYYFRARYFDSGLGRFINRDPLSYVDGLGLYNGYFVPLFLDPFGLSNGTWSYDQEVSSKSDGSLAKTIFFFKFTPNDECCETEVTYKYSHANWEPDKDGKFVKVNDGAVNPRESKQRPGFKGFAFHLGGKGNYKKRELTFEICAYCTKGGSEKLLGCVSDKYKFKYEEAALVNGGNGLVQTLVDDMPKVNDNPDSGYTPTAPDPNVKGEDVPAPTVTEGEAKEVQDSLDEINKKATDGYTDEQKEQRRKLREEMQRRRKEQYGDY